MSKQKRDLVISAVIAAVLLLAAGLRVSGAENLFAVFFGNKWLNLAAALAAQVLFGARYYKRVVRMPLSGGMSIDTLIALGILSSFLLSVYNSFFNQNAGVNALCFESPSVLVTLALFGEYLEATAAGHIPDAVKRLPAPDGQTAAVVRDGKRAEIAAELIVTGDIVIVRKGDTIPVDGEVLNGLASVDESALTGESEPVDKQPGDKVACASVCMYGEFEMRAERVGEYTALSRIIRALSQAYGGADSLAGVYGKIPAKYVPAALFVSLAVFVWYWLFTGELVSAFNAAICVIMAACPCALGLAAPAVIEIITGKAAENGIIFETGEYLTKPSGPDIILLGKTGVITDGRPEVTDIRAFSGFFEEEVVYFAAAAAKNSEHPIDKAIYRYTQPAVIVGGIKEHVVRSGSDEIVALHSDRHGFIGSVPEAEEFEALPGYGLRAVIGGRETLIGTRRLIRENGVNISAYEKVLAELEEAGKTITLIVIGRKVAGVIATADTIRENTNMAVKKLKALGVDVYMLTGDSVATAKSIASQAGIDNVISGVLPTDKAGGISRLKGTGKTVAAVCCGISDEPALEAADIGIAVGFDSSGKTADITLARAGLELVPEAISLSNAAVRAIRRGLLLSLSCSAAGIPLAAAGVYPPSVMAFVMAFSLVSTVTNTIKLQRLYSR